MLPLRLLVYTLKCISSATLLQAANGSRAKGCIWPLVVPKSSPTPVPILDAANISLAQIQAQAPLGVSKQLPAALEKRRWLCIVIHTTACFLAVQRTTQTHTSPSRRVTETQFQVYLDYYTQSHLLGFKPANDIARPREFTHWPGGSA